MRTFFNLLPECLLSQTRINQQRKKGVVYYIYIAFNKHSNDYRRDGETNRQQDRIVENSRQKKQMKY